MNLLPAWARPIYWQEAALCLPALPLLLIVSHLLGEDVRGAIAAGAAFSVGFGASRGLRGRRWGAMGAATVGISAAAFVGSLIGHSFALLLLCGGAAAALCAVLALVDDDLWWVALQTVIALLVAGYYAGPAEAALGRASMTLLGGAVQMACVISLATLRPSAGAMLPAGPPKTPAERALLGAQAGRAAACVVLALFAAHKLGFSNSYWAPMTAMLVLKPGLHETRIRGWARLLGTAAGCGVATLYVIAFHDARGWLVVGLAVTSGAAFALQKANYAAFTSAVTATVVLLLSLGSAAVVQNAEHRLIATLIGGVIALMVAAILPHRDAPAVLPAPDRVGR